MAAQPAHAPSTRMLVEGVVMPIQGSQSSGVVLDRKLPVKRPRAPRRRRARWWLIVLLVLVVGAATAGYFQFPQLRAWWLDQIS
jgi:hypothetical protein